MNDKIKNIDDELSQLRKQSEYIIKSSQKPEEKSEALKAIAFKTTQLTGEKNALLATIQIDPNTEVTGEVISINASQKI